MTATVDGAEQRPPQNLTEISASIRQRHEQTTAQLLELDADTKALSASATLGVGDAADAGTAASDNAERSLLAAALREQLARLEAALQRLDAGTWGTCERCGQQVPPGRLEIMPWATHCVPCQGTTERSHS